MPHCQAERCVQKADGEALAEDLKMLFFEAGAPVHPHLWVWLEQATAKDATLVDAIFYGLAEGKLRGHQAP